MPIPGIINSARRQQFSTLQPMKPMGDISSNPAPDEQAAQAQASSSGQQPIIAGARTKILRAPGTVPLGTEPIAPEPVPAPENGIARPKQPILRSSVPGSPTTPAPSMPSAQNPNAPSYPTGGPVIDGIPVPKVTGAQPVDGGGNPGASRAPTGSNPFTAPLDGTWIDDLRRKGPGQEDGVPLGFSGEANGRNYIWGHLYTAQGNASGGNELRNLLAHYGIPWGSTAGSLGYTGGGAGAPDGGGTNTTGGGAGAGAGTNSSGTGSGATAWNPTSGIIDRIRGITPEDVNATGYTAQTGGPAAQAGAEGYDASGYTAERAPDAAGFEATGYAPETADAAQVGENVSQAANRIIGQDSELMQREQAAAAGEANRRGLLNTTMAVQAGRSAVLDKAAQLAAGDVQTSQFNVDQLNQMRKFNADAKNAAGAFLADAKNKSAEFLAAAKNQNGQFNAQQANDAAAFSANAKNAAAQMLAAAKNTAAMFNAGEGNKQAQFAIEQLNRAAEFAAAAENAARAQNATAHNEAMQRYTDAMNAALAAQNDAENLARRDTAQINAQLQQTAMQGQTSRDVANISGQTSRDVANINSGTQLQISAAEIAQRDRELGATMQRFGVQMSQQESQFTRSLSAQQFQSYVTGLQAGMSLDMPPESRQNWLHNYNAVWAASGNLPFDIDMTQFPPAGTNDTNNNTSTNNSTNTGNPAAR